MRRLLNYNRNQSKFLSHAVFLSLYMIMKKTNCCSKKKVIYCFYLRDYINNVLLCTINMAFLSYAKLRMFYRKKTFNI